MLEEERFYRCHDCGFCFKVSATPELFYALDLPFRCPSGNYDNPKIKFFNPKTKRTKVKRCTSENFDEIPSECRRTDFQELKVQELLQNLGPGVVPSSLSVVLRDDLVGQVNAGDEVVVTGLVWRRWSKLRKGMRCDVELFIEANNIEKSNDFAFPNMRENLTAGNSHRRASLEQIDSFEKFWSKHRDDEFVGRSKIIEAACPNLSGLAVPKLALLLVLISGCDTSEVNLTQPQENRWAKYSEDSSTDVGSVDLEESRHANGGSTSKGRSSHHEHGNPCDESSVSSRIDAKSKGTTNHQKGKGSQRRSRCHLLLVGDPGTGKSQILQRAVELSDRAVSTTGLGCTAAGLTCAAVRDGPEWMLEAGALVLADGGVCCIDEFSCIKKENRASIHEAMEQQTVSVAKAGLVNKLNARCSVIAATNVQSSSQSHDPSAVLDTTIGLPLLSRFDIVVVFIDSTENDAMTAQFLLDKANQNIKPNHSILPTSASSFDVDKSDGTFSSSSSTSSSSCSVSSPLFWTSEVLKDYIAYVRAEFHPLLCADAEVLIVSYYSELRKLSAGGTTTVRTFESLIRLCQSHARLMCHSIILLNDAVAVIWMMEAALSGRKVGRLIKGDEGVGREGMLSDFRVTTDLSQISCVHGLLSETLLLSLSSSSCNPFQQLKDQKRGGREGGGGGGGGGGTLNSGLAFDITSYETYVVAETRLLETLRLTKDASGKLHPPSTADDLIVKCENIYTDDLKKNNFLSSSLSPSLSPSLLPDQNDDSPTSSPSNSRRPFPSLTNANLKTWAPPPPPPSSSKNQRFLPNATSFSVVPASPPSSYFQVANATSFETPYPYSSPEAASAWPFTRLTSKRKPFSSMNLKTTKWDDANDFFATQTKCEMNDIRRTVTDSHLTTTTTTSHDSAAEFSSKMLEKSYVSSSSHYPFTFTTANLHSSSSDSHHRNSNDPAVANFSQRRPPSRVNSNFDELLPLKLEEEEIEGRDGRFSHEKYDRSDNGEFHTFSFSEGKTSNERGARGGEANPFFFDPTQFSRVLTAQTAQVDDLRSFSKMTNVEKAEEIFKKRTFSQMYGTPSINFNQFN